jgi:thiamine-phosphate pyrophosphorylase
MLQLITDGASVEEIVRQSLAAMRGGCRWIQVRMKEATDEEVRAVVERLQPVCRETKTTLLLDDRVELAKTLQVDGVHLGKLDMSPAEARKILGDDAIIGGTANTLEDVVRLSKLPVNYLGIGPFRFTQTKKRLAPTLGLSGYRNILDGMARNGISLPVVAIGGITEEDVAEILATGVNGIAISGAIVHEASAEDATRRFLERMPMKANEW